MVDVAEAPPFCFFGIVKLVFAQTFESNDSIKMPLSQVKTNGYRVRNPSSIFY